MKKSNPQFVQGMLFLIFAQIMVGINIVFSKLILASIPVLLVLTIRFSLAALILLPLHWLTPAKNTPISEYFSKLNKIDWVFIFAQALCAGVFFNILMLLGLRYTDANIAGIITSALPAIIALMAWLILGENISGKKAVCVAFATLGLLVIAYDKFDNMKAGHSFVGDALVLLSLFPEALYYILSKMRVLPLPVFLMSSLLNGINALILIAYHAIFIPLSLHIHGLDYLILIILGLSAGLFYVFWFMGCQKVDGVMASLSTAIMPLATVVLAWLLLGEQLSLGQALGMGIVLLSIAAYAKR